VSTIRVVSFDGTFEGWRTAARAMLQREWSPDVVLWQSALEAQQSLLDDRISAGPQGDNSPDTRRRVPKRFVELAQAAACYRHPERWSLLYRVLWRLTHGEPLLLDILVDPDVHRLAIMERAIRRDVHKMKAFVRFRLVDDGETEGGRYVAWFAPAHEIVERAAPFFVTRFMSMAWSILTPDRSIHWDRDELVVGPGIPRSEAPKDDALEELWRTYYANIFNPTRVKTRAMRSEMPKKYWVNLPEAGLIPGLVQGAPARVKEMIERERQRNNR
jgi:probable DNA metabolism protein